MDCEETSQLVVTGAYMALSCFGSVLTFILLKFMNDRPLIQQSVASKLFCDALVIIILFPCTTSLTLLIDVMDWSNIIGENVFALIASNILSCAQYYAAFVLILHCLLRLIKIHIGQEFDIAQYFRSSEENALITLRLIAVCLTFTLHLAFYQFSTHPQYYYQLHNDASTSSGQTYIQIYTLDMLALCLWLVNAMT